MSKYVGVGEKKFFYNFSLAHRGAYFPQNGITDGTELFCSLKPLPVKDFVSHPTPGTEQP